MTDIESRKGMNKLYNERRKSYKNYGKVYTSDIVVGGMICYIDFNSITKDTKILEPSFGKGAFIFPIIDTLLTKYDIDHIMESMIYGVEIDDDDFNFVVNKLKDEYNYTYSNKTKLFCADFLLLDLSVDFDYAIGNFPYVSFSNIYSEDHNRKDYIKILIEKYGVSTTSDLYVSFFMKTFNLMKTDGRHIFICSDSWIHSKFGEVLRNRINDLHLSFFITSPYDYFFDFDTNAVITVIDNKKQNDNLTTLYYDGFKYDKKIEADVKYLINNKHRNILCVYPHIIDEEFLDKINIGTKLGDYINLGKSNLIFNQIKDSLDDSSNKLFYMDQARVGKPALYKNNITIDELKYSFSGSVRKNDNVYISSIIDRMLLMFWMENNEFVTHTSKYYSLTLKRDDFDKRLIYFLLLNPITQLNIEIFLKEGTKRSKRVGEQGFTKEINHNALLLLPTIDLHSLSDSTISKMSEYLDKWQNTIEFNIENIYKRQDYVDIINDILNDMGISDGEELIEKGLTLYYKRMRNINYRNIT